MNQHGGRSTALRWRVFLAGLAVAASGLLGGAGPASAQSSGRQTFTLVFTADPAQEPGRVIARGPITGVGTVRVTAGGAGVLSSAYDFDNGSLSVTATPVGGSFEPDFRSCTARATSSSNVEITGGTGSLAGASGSGVATSRALLVGQRSAGGECLLGQQPPARGVEIVTVEATVTVP